MYLFTVKSANNSFQGGSEIPEKQPVHARPLIRDEEGLGDLVHHRVKHIIFLVNAF